jgi:aspartate kinase
MWTGSNKLPEESKGPGRKGNKVVVVVSARAGVTNQLIERASAILKNPSEREMDVLMTCGEQETIALMSLALHALKVPAVSRTGWQSEIITEGIHTKARIREVKCGDIRKQLRAGKGGGGGWISGCE